MSNFDNQLNRMKGLITYGQVNESVNKNNAGSLEYHKEAADGKVYGIVRECHKFYIKTTTPDKATIVESYDYIGGWNNHKDYEYNDLRTAQKNFDFKMRSINEAHNVIAEEKHVDNNEIITESTESMRNELNRQMEIMRNSVKILSEGSYVDMAKPFAEKAEAKLDKDPKYSESKPEDAAEPFGDKEKEEKPTDAKVEGSVASEHPTGGKVVKVNESCEGGVCECGDPNCDGSCKGLQEEEEFTEGDFDIEDETDSDVDTVDPEIKDDAIDGEVEDDPIDGEEPAEEVEVGAEDDIDIDDDFETRLDDLQADIDALRAQIEADSKEVEDEIEEPSTEDDEPAAESETSAEESEDEPLADETPTEDIHAESEDEIEDKFDDISESKKNYLTAIAESVVRKLMNEETTELHDFGKHPGYRKKPMTTPPAEIEEKPFGSEIGNTAPFSEKVLSMITDQVVEKLKKKI